MHIESCSIYNDRIRRRLSMLVLSEHDSACQDGKRASSFRIFFLRCDRTSPYSPNRTKIQSKKRLSVHIYIYIRHILEGPAVGMAVRLLHSCSVAPTDRDITLSLFCPELLPICYAPSREQRQSGSYNAQQHQC